MRMPNISGLAKMPATKRGKFALGASVGMGAMYAANKIRGRSSGSNGLNPRSTGGMAGPTGMMNM